MYKMFSIVLLIIIALLYLPAHALLNKGQTANDYFLKGESYIKKNDYNNACQAYLTAQKAVLLESSKEAFEHYLNRQKTDKNTYDKEEALIARTLALGALGNNDEALKQISELVAILNSKYAKVHFLKASMLLEIDYKAALKEFDLVLKYDPNSYNAHLMKGVIYLDNVKDYKKALKEFDLAMKQNPNDPSCKSFREKALEMLK